MRKPTDLQSKKMHIPLMYAFRDGFEKRDSAKEIDQREGGERVISKRGMLSRTGAKEPELKRDLSVDLGALVNTINLASVEDIGGLDRVRKSVLNFGLDDIGHMSSEEVAVESIAADLKTALLNHEPRLDPETLDVARSVEHDEVNQRVEFKVSAELEAKPVNLPLEFIAEIDVCSGKVQLSRLSGAKK